MPSFLSNLGQFSVNKCEKSNFLARTWIEYFRMGIFVIPSVYLIKKHGCQTQAYISVFQCFLHDSVEKYLITKADV